MKCLSQLAERYVGEEQFGSIEWMVALDGAPWQAGLVDRSGRAPADAPIYRIYSMTKPVIALAAMRLVERNRIRLSDPLSAYLPPFAGMEVLDSDGNRSRAHQPIKLVHLLSHTAGLSYGFITSCPVGRIYRDLDLNDPGSSLADICDRLSQTPLAFEPGTDWKYSMSFDVMARVLEVATGKPLADVIAAEVSGPLGLEDTGFHVPDDKRHRVAQMYGTDRFDDIFDPQVWPEGLVETSHDAFYPADRPDFARGGIGLFSTAGDYMKIARAIASGLAADGSPFLSEAARQTMLANRAPERSFPLTVEALVFAGYGWNFIGRMVRDLGSVESPTTLGEYGMSGAASTYFWIDRENNSIGIVMAQHLGAKVPLGDDMRVAAYADIAGLT